MRLFYYPNGPWLLLLRLLLQIVSKEGRQGESQMDISILSSSFSRSPPLKANLFTLMDAFGCMKDEEMRVYKQAACFSLPGY